MEGMALTMKNILVTGDRGYIGSSLVPLLLKNKYNVVGFDTEFFKKTIPSKYKNPNYKIITKDIREVDVRDIEGIDAIIHLSALSNDPMGDLDDELTQDINFKSTIRLAKLAKKTGVKRFLFSSSCSIYGIAKEDTVSEKSKVNPLTAYARSKINSEKNLIKLADKNFCVGILRNSTVYGYAPKFRNDLVVNNLVTTALALCEIRIMSDGTPWRPLIDVRDLSNIFMQFLKVESKKINGKVINIGFNENNFQVKDLVAEVKKCLPKSRINFTGEHGKDSRSYKVSFNKFHKLFPNIKQSWRLSKSVKDLVTMLKKNKYSKKDFVSQDFTRISILKDLLTKKKINNMLYWN